MAADWYSHLGCVWKGGDPSKPVLEYAAEHIIEKKSAGLDMWLANRLFGRLADPAGCRRHGESYVGMWVELPGGHRRRPSVCFVRAEHLPPGRIVGDWWRVAPDLIAEVVNPYEPTWETAAKVSEYFAAGVRLVWVVLPNVRQVHRFDSPTAIRILSVGDTLTADPVVPGFALPLADLFPPPAEDA